MRRQEMGITNEEFVALWDEGRTIAEISRIAGVTTNAADRVIRELGVPPRCLPLAIKLEPIKAEFEAMWRDPTMTKEDVAARFGIGRTTVLRWARALRLPLKAYSPPDWSGPVPGDPTEEEIKELGAYLRASRVIRGSFRFDDEP